MAEEHTKKVTEFESNVGGEGAVETKDRGMFDFLGKKEKPQAQEEVIATEFEKVKIEETKAEEEHKEDEQKHSLQEMLHRSDSSSRSSSDEEEVEGGEKKKKKKEKKGLKEKIEEKFGGEKKEEESAVPVEKCDKAGIYHPESPEKKGFTEKMKEKLPGQHKNEEIATPPFAAPAECVAAETHVPVEKCHEAVTDHPETPEKKGFIEKMKEKLPGQHKKDEEVATPPSATPAESVAAETHEEETKEKKGILEKIKEKLPGYHSKTEDEKEKESSASH